MEIGIVKPVRIEDEMKGAYLDYAMSVITARALPDVRDGLKPVQRRILFAMHELGLRHTTPYKKSARIVGEVLGKYHPHGDAPVYEAMVRMAQDFSMRYPLVDGQGNFGSVDGDPPAAMRYTEARLAAIADEMLADIDKNTVDLAPNFDDTLREPKVLPCKLPNLLVNGSAGIAVGMATNIPPHNLGEVSSALIYLIGRFGEALDAGVPFQVVWNRAFGLPVDSTVVAEAVKSLRGPAAETVKANTAKLSGRLTDENRVQALLGYLDDLLDVPPDKLMEMVKGPDFPTAGTILGVDGIKNAYATGHGRITIRARAHTEDMRGGRTQIIITELPFQVNKATLQEKIAELVRERRVEGISELRDESDRQGMRIVVELRKDAVAKKVLNQLFKYTAMQSAFSVNMLALVDGQPRVLTLKLVLLHYLNHRREVITRRTEFDLQKARQRAHILEGLKIALEHLDEVIATIRRSKDAETARTALMKNFKLSEIQAQAILDMQLRRLAALERQRILQEYAETLKLIAHLEDLLAHPVKIMYLIRDELRELAAKYGDSRRTNIVAEEAADFTEEDLVPEQEVIVSISGKGYVRRMLADSYRLQRRGKGFTGTVAREEDPAIQLVLANTRENLLLLSNRGRAYQVKVNDLPDVGRQTRGLPASNFISIDDQERIVAALPIGEPEGRFLVFATRLGEVKRVAASEYTSARSGGIIGLAVPEGDELSGAVLTTGRQDVILVTAAGQAIRFGEADLRPSGRASGGVRGIKLAGNDYIIACGAARTGASLLLVTRRGFGKRTGLSEFSTQGRGGGGIRAANVGVKNGEVVGARVAAEADELVLVSADNTLLRTPVAEVPEMGRAALGAPVMLLGRDDRVIAVNVVPARERPPGGKSTPPGEDGPDSRVDSQIDSQIGRQAAGAQQKKGRPSGKSAADELSKDAAREKDSPRQKQPSAAVEAGKSREGRRPKRPDSLTKRGAAAAPQPTTANREPSAATRPAEPAVSKKGTGKNVAPASQTTAAKPEAFPAKARRGDTARPPVVQSPRQAAPRKEEAVQGAPEAAPQSSKAGKRGKPAGAPAATRLPYKTDSLKPAGKVLTRPTSAGVKSTAGLESPQRVPGVMKSKARKDSTDPAIASSAVSDWIHLPASKSAANEGVASADAVPTKARKPAGAGGAGQIKERKAKAEDKTLLGSIAATLKRKDAPGKKTPASTSPEEQRQGPASDKDAKALGAKGKSFPNQRRLPL